MPSQGTAKRHAHLVVRDRERGAPVLAAVDDDVHALAQPHRRLRARILEAAHAVDPRPRRVHDRLRAHLDRSAVRRDLDRAQPDDLGVVENDGAAVGCCADVRERQPAVVRPCILVERARAQAVVLELRHELFRAFCADEAVQLRARERRVDDDSALHEPRPVRPVLVERKEERQPPHEVRRDDVHQHAPLVVRLAHEPDVAEAQVAQPAVDELRRRARRRAGEVALVDERDRAGRAPTPPRRCRRRRSRRRSRAGRTRASRAARGPATRLLSTADSSRPGMPAVSDTTTRPNGARGGFSRRQAVMRPARVALEDRRRVRIAEPAGVRARAAMARGDERHALRRRAAHDDGVAVVLRRSRSPGRSSRRSCRRAARRARPPASAPRRAPSSTRSRCRSRGGASRRSRAPCSAAPRSSASSQWIDESPRPTSSSQPVFHTSRPSEPLAALPLLGAQAAPVRMREIGQAAVRRGSSRRPPAAARTSRAEPDLPRRRARARAHRHLTGRTSRSARSRG